MGNIYRFIEFNARHREQQRKPSNIKSDICHIIRAPLLGETDYSGVLL